MPPFNTRKTPSPTLGFKQNSLNINNEPSLPGTTKLVDIADKQRRCSFARSCAPRHPLSHAGRCRTPRKQTLADGLARNELHDKEKNVVRVLEPVDHGRIYTLPTFQLCRHRKHTLLDLGPAASIPLIKIATRMRTGGMVPAEVVIQVMQPSATRSTNPQSHLALRLSEDPQFGHSGMVSVYPVVRLTTSQEVELGTPRLGRRENPGHLVTIDSDVTIIRTWHDDSNPQSSR